METEEEWLYSADKATIRLKCLKLAIMANDPDDRMDALSAMGTAQAFYDYVTTGAVPQTEKTESDDVP